MLVRKKTDFFQNKNLVFQLPLTSPSFSGHNFLHVPFKCISLVFPNILHYELSLREHLFLRFQVSHLYNLLANLDH